MDLLFPLISLLASLLGAICGIGGGVIIKPVLDLFGLADAATINFLSSCTVLSMSLYSVGKGLMARDSLVDLRLGTPLALGAAAGGILGNRLFRAVAAAFGSSGTVYAAQAAVLSLLTALTLLYTLFRSKLRSYPVRRPAACLSIGLLLGLLSSFLGIGGGPFNLAVLFFFFDMDTKAAAQNSLYIILFSQTANLAVTLLSRSVPPFSPTVLLSMVLGGLCGGASGRFLYRRMSGRAIDRLFLLLITVILFISLFNVWQYSVWP